MNQCPYCHEPYSSASAYCDKCGAYGNQMAANGHQFQPAGANFAQIAPAGESFEPAAPNFEAANSQNPNAYYNNYPNEPQNSNKFYNNYSNAPQNPNGYNPQFSNELYNNSNGYNAGYANEPYDPNDYNAQFSNEPQDPNAYYNNYPNEPYDPNGYNVHVSNNSQPNLNSYSGNYSTIPAEPNNYGVDHSTIPYNDPNDYNGDYSTISTDANSYSGNYSTIPSETNSHNNINYSTMPYNDPNDYNGDYSTISTNANGYTPNYSTVQMESSPSDNANFMEQGLYSLSDAARRIAAVDQTDYRKPHVPRLAPLSDPTGQFQGQTVPPSNPSESFIMTQPARQQIAPEHMPDNWPQEADTGEHDPWLNHNDPLIGRSFPNSNEAARIERADVKRARAEGFKNVVMPELGKRKNILRIVLLCVGALALLALIIDGALGFLVITRPDQQANKSGGPPLLTLSTHTASYNQNVTLFISHFPASHYVLLMHDIGEPLHVNKTGSAIIRTAADGSASAVISIDKNWESGQHTIVAEDTITHYTANATIQIAEGASLPSQLKLSSTKLDFGTATQGANTIRTISMSNTGSTPISWTASSDQPWLLVSPDRGTFSEDQTVQIGAQRTDLNPGNYEGTITISSNVGAPQKVTVTMGVSALNTSAGAVLTVTPAVLSFTASDGGQAPDPQTLTISNPGSQPLNWSLASNTTVQSSVPSTPATAQAMGNWLSLDQNSGTTPPGGTSTVHVIVQSSHLLPGTYINALTFNGDQGAQNSPQSVSVSLTVQPACSLVPSTGTISFTAVAGQDNPGNQSLTLRTSTGCASAIPWTATPSANWLSITPPSGQLKDPTTISISANTSGLAPKTYNATISLVTPQGTQSIAVQLTVQPSTTNAPVISAAPLSINFTAAANQANIPGQAVTITNTGSGSLQWKAANASQNSNWLSFSPASGTIAAGQTNQMTIHVNTSSLSPGNYSGQITLSGSGDNNVKAGGSPQTVTVNLVVSSPCALTLPSSNALSYTVAQNAKSAAPLAQRSVSLTASGNCNWPLNWQAQTVGKVSWLTLSTSSGKFTASGQSATITPQVDPSGLAPGTYTAQVAITAKDGSGASMQSNPPTFSVSLTVRAACSLSISPESLTFTAQAGQSSVPAQTLHISQNGGCNGPAKWQVTPDSNSASWLSVNNGSGAGSGSVTVSVNPGSAAAGTSQKGTLTISASDGNVTVNPQTVTVTLNITGSTNQK
ncbi:hypothetical protein EPA93_27315 [Ktedonosporobacter rubrisoli]|uniref:BACON domain-containing protein n=1 Tax=Ktedonosporobacter rubrisoli TaxID=2509675 RepID=A0A4P6JV00_KTERU|nr:BACON domain-containing carbohydrate-binding protein [Ktedonosporobacter rubrisoli]QBD79488.1 hypothetical protein EPA93_27315 [Ktedonosporobacter rubrisoli]